MGAYCTQMGTMCTHLGTPCTQNGVGLEELLDQKFDFSKVFMSSKFKPNPQNIEVVKKNHYYISKRIIF